MRVGNASGWLVGWLTQQVSEGGHFGVVKHTEVQTLDQRAALPQTQGRTRNREEAAALPPVSLAVRLPSVWTQLGTSVTAAALHKPSIPASFHSGTQAQVFIPSLTPACLRYLSISPPTPHTDEPHAERRASCRLRRR